MKRGWPQGWPFTDFWVRQKKLCSFFCRQSPARNPRKKRSDHSFYHRQTRNTRKQWTKKARGASVLERKRHESTQSAREDRPMSVGVVEAARSSRVTQTKKPSSFVQDAQIRRLFLIQNSLFFVTFSQSDRFCFEAWILPRLSSTNFLRIYSGILSERAPKGVGMSVVFCFYAVLKNTVWLISRKFRKNIFSPIPSHGRSTQMPNTVEIFASKRKSGLAFLLVCKTAVVEKFTLWAVRSAALAPFCLQEPGKPFTTTLVHINNSKLQKNRKTYSVFQENCLTRSISHDKMLVQQDSCTVRSGTRQPECWLPPSFSWRKSISSV